ncbi:class E sortase [Streptomyces sp. NPDC058739]|uniref:class E sortase n=1 Tax=Streptomyces sp. NPDC058739 TaxID=3346618 RepID=UPI0036C67B0B
MRVPVVQHRTLRRRARRRSVLWGGGEVLVTVGVVLLLLVVHQLWWTNRQARAAADRQVHALEREWEGSGTPTPPGGPASGDARSGGRGGDEESRPVPGGEPAPGRAATPSRGTHPAYAILTIPRLDLRVPVAEGIRKADVLDLGYAGHYPGTQQPGQAGNFALAGHRNTHGEPFRHLDRLRRGDRVLVETATAVYAYTVDRTLARTSPRDSGVLRPVPASLVHPGRGYREPGYYLTLTTCTPAYSSAYRLVVWGKLTSVGLR